MESLKITKADLLRLATIVAHRHPQNEELVIQEMPICWKILSIHPITENETLIAYIHKYNAYDNPVLVAYDKLRSSIPVHPSDIPTVARYNQKLHAVEPADSGGRAQHY